MIAAINFPNRMFGLRSVWRSGYGLQSRLLYRVIPTKIMVLGANLTCTFSEGPCAIALFDL